ncbi:SAM-dependent methyltransferase [Streptomyces vastus]|uniref:SAM-dependent methyltransferase n=1 Tax=Streptomyces vastus TaxID=285451 RepID=UPI0031DA5056
MADRAGIVVADRARLPARSTGLNPRAASARCPRPRRSRWAARGCDAQGGELGAPLDAVYLARHGWRVAAVDLVDRAVRQARKKADAAGVDVTVLCGDATRLDEVGVPGPYDLFFDLSCYCGIPPHRRDAYAAGLTTRAAPGAQLLMFGYGPEAFDDPISCVTADELRARFAGWQLTDVTPGTNPVPTFWFTLHRAAVAA